MRTRAVEIKSGAAVLNGDLVVPNTPGGLVIFAHGSGSSRFSHRNRSVAAALNRAGYATLLLDLLTENEEAIDNTTRQFRFDVGRLANRVVAAVDWASADPVLRDLPIACFGASTGAAAALMAAAERPGIVRAVISRGGRPDLAGSALPRVRAATLLIVGGADTTVISLNREAKAQMQGGVSIAIVPGASHLFEEPGALEEVARKAVHWCDRHLRLAAA